MNAEENEDNNVDMFSNPGMNHIRNKFLGQQKKTYLVLACNVT